MEKDLILRFENLRIDYQAKEGLVRPVEGLTFGVERGKITAIIGESGSGKSTMVGAILRLLASNGTISPDSRIMFDGTDILAMKPEELRRYRWRKASMVFQAAQNALNPTLRIREQLLDSVADHGEDGSSPEYRQRLHELLRMVQLEPDRVLDVYPHQLSGGMRQRVIIVMAMVMEPEFIILDEPTTALDVITQHHIFEILKHIHGRTGRTMLFITHDMSAVAMLADSTGVMYGGRLLELAPTADLFENPVHPYTRGLLNSIPSIEGDEIRRMAIRGQPPDLIHKPAGCVFHPRCDYADERCRSEVPVLQDLHGGRQAACLKAGRCW